MLYGSGNEDAGMQLLEKLFRDKAKPSSNNPDDVPLLQELSRADAEGHLAYAAYLHSKGEPSRAATQWESGCVRLEAYVRDAADRAEAQQRAELQNTSPDGQGAGPLAPIMAPLVGLENDSPYVNQRPGQAYFFYQVDGQAQRRDVGSIRAAEDAWHVDPNLSCSVFRDDTWVDKNRPLWPPNLRRALSLYVAEVPPAPFTMPPKGAQPTLGEREFTDNALRARMGLGKL
jgi:hypothetical protein